MRRLILSGFAVGLFVGAWLDDAVAQIYRYTDERGTAHYVDGLPAVPERYRATAEPLPFRNAPPAAAPAVDVSREPEKGATTITFTPGQRILTDARINDSTPVRLLVDTGADRTLISRRALVAAGVSLTRGARTEQIHGVTGSAETQRVAIDSLAVGGARVGHMTVYALDMNQPGFEGLLGRDFLEQFNVNIDSSRGVVTIKPK